MLRIITSADEFKDKKEVDCNRVSHLGNLKNWSEAFNKNVSREREIFFFLVGKRKKETQKRVHSTNTFSGEPATHGVKERERQKKKKKKKKKKKTQQSSLCAEYVERT